MPPAINVVRAATREDAEVAVITLSRAFEHDPPLDWLVRDDDQRRDALEAFFRLAFDELTFPHGCVEISEDLSGVALWTPPGAWQLGWRRQLALLPTLLRVLGWRHLLRGQQAATVLERAHPRPPHYYLFGLGVDPARQNQGIGAALLRSRLDRCDDEGAAAYLEASTASSRRLYERWGFVAREPLLLGAGAPPVWPMWRDPRRRSRR